MALAQFEITFRHAMTLRVPYGTDPKVNTSNASLVHVKCLRAHGSVIHLELTAVGRVTCFGNLEITSAVRPIVNLEIFTACRHSMATLKLGILPHGPLVNLELRAGSTQIVNFKCV